MASNEDIDEFITCGVCLWEYDEEIRKPKFLPCSHTICLPCLQGIVQGTTVKSITCPFCRHCTTKDTTNVKKWVLPNNTYALQMLKNKKAAEKNSSAVSYPQLQNKNIDILLKLKEELLKMRGTGMNTLSQAIQKRKEVQEQITLIIEAINLVGEEARKVQDANNLCLAEMVSIVEENGSINTKVSKNDQGKIAILSELISLVEDSTTNDSVETLKQKMKKSVDICERKLAEATTIASEYEIRQKIRIQVHLFDEKDRPIPTISFLEKGFRFQPISSSLNGPLCRQDSKLLSHAVFWLLQRQKISIKKEDQSACNSKSLPVRTVTCPLVRILPQVPYSSKKFVLGQSSIFILRFSNSGTSLGEIHVRPSLAFHPTFVQQLGEFCFEKPTDFSSFLDKAIPGVFVSFSLMSSHMGFYPMVPSMFDSSSRKTEVADVNTAIGIAMVESTGNDMVTGWNFIIPLKDWHNPKCTVSHSILNNELFGRIIRCTTNGSVTIMSKSNKYERENYVLTIESVMKSAMKS